MLRLNDNNESLNDVGGQYDDIVDSKTAVPTRKHKDTLANNSLESVAFT